jgi:hypothetical protein
MGWIDDGKAIAYPWLAEMANGGSWDGCFSGSQAAPLLRCRKQHRMLNGLKSAQANARKLLI